MSWTGRLQCTAAFKNGRTVILDSYGEGALKLMRSVYLDSAHPTLYLVHIGGGYVDGDSYDMEIFLEPSARLMVTTQSAAKIYKTPSTPVRQYTRLSLGEQSVLEYFPDPTIAYEHARFVQETTVYITPSSTFVYGEIITPGWSESGELFRYDWIRTKLKVHREGTLVLFDHLYLHPSHHLTDMLQLGHYTHVGSMVVLSPFITKGVLESFGFLMDQMSDGIYCGFSETAAPGFSVRVLAHDTMAIETLFQRIHQFIRPLYGEREPVFWRKY
ncbi:urease accessory protein UreD [Geobacillus thermocatenulatus]|uniref:Urease accessory protein UreD n=1 Tax=Geobacillus thermocatenulatus TaxID=33938 RepID=A0A226Q1Z6_9BACL|nr:urease accessory protein UreD [Geobacillus thermocatenulatus]ASS99333.1 urease accessory protein UreD [Geobacillus thermocatenulatus]OXB85750.1 urease accessory protein UreD [Geobacillus thermocatenulatus]